MLAAPSVPRPTVTPAARHFGIGATPLASFMLLSGLCDTARAGALEDGDVVVGQPDAVGGDDVRPEKPIDSSQRSASPGAARRDHRDLVLGFGDVDQDRASCSAPRGRGPRAAWPRPPCRASGAPGPA